MTSSCSKVIFLNVKFKEITREGKKFKLVEIKSFLVHIGPPLHNKHPIIDKICLSYDLVEHYVFPFLQIEAT